ncbi:hypothetical protein EBQ91_02550 [bacterium]|nr:hypothetical protein [bacterium]
MPNNEDLLVSLRKEYQQAKKTAFDTLKESSSEELRLSNCRSFISASDALKDEACRALQADLEKFADKLQFPSTPSAANSSLWADILSKDFSTPTPIEAIQGLIAPISEKINDQLEVYIDKGTFSKDKTHSIDADIKAITDLLSAIQKITQFVNATEKVIQDSYEEKQEFSSMMSELKMNKERQHVEKRFVEDKDLIQKSIDSLNSSCLGLNEALQTLSVKFGEHLTQGQDTLSLADDRLFVRCRSMLDVYSMYMIFVDTAQETLKLSHKERYELLSSFSSYRDNYHSDFNKILDSDEFKRPQSQYNLFCQYQKFLDDSFKTKTKKILFSKQAAQKKSDKEKEKQEKIDIVGGLLCRVETLGHRAWNKSNFSDFQTLYAEKEKIRDLIDDPKMTPKMFEKNISEYDLKLSVIKNKVRDLDVKKIKENDLQTLLIRKLDAELNKEYPAIEKINKILSIAGSLLTPQHNEYYKSKISQLETLEKLSAEQKYLSSLAQKISDLIDHPDTTDKLFGSTVSEYLLKLSEIEETFSDFIDVEKIKENDLQTPLIRKLEAELIKKDLDVDKINKIFSIARSMLTPKDYEEFNLVIELIKHKREIQHKYNSFLQSIVETEDVALTEQLEAMETFHDSFKKTIPPDLIKQEPGVFLTTDSLIMDARNVLKIRGEIDKAVNFLERSKILNLGSDFLKIMGKDTDAIIHDGCIEKRVESLGSQQYHTLKKNTKRIKKTIEGLLKTRDIRHPQREQLVLLQKEIEVQNDILKEWGSTKAKITHSLYKAGQLFSQQLEKVGLGFPKKTSTQKESHHKPTL